jgi:hypothetical protein
MSSDKPAATNAARRPFWESVDELFIAGSEKKTALQKSRRGK